MYALQFCFLQVNVVYAGKAASEGKQFHRRLYSLLFHISKCRARTLFLTCQRSRDSRREWFGRLPLKYRPLVSLHPRGVSGTPSVGRIPLQSVSSVPSAYLYAHCAKEAMYKYQGATSGEVSGIPRKTCPFERNAHGS